MAFLSRKPALTAEERVERHKLMLSDAISLAIILAITALLAVAAHAIYRSYASHRASLARRWADRGVAALNQKRPDAAISALRSALALHPGDREIQINLAEALAAAGRTDQAISYFGTLEEARPGEGMINLQLARLAARQGHQQQALDYYQRAIYGDWRGNGYLRRREVRLEMIHYLISRGLELRARGELLISAGNAPQSDSAFLARIADAMAQAQDPVNALRVYRQVLDHQPRSAAALEGAGRAAYRLGQYREANRYLSQAAALPKSQSGKSQNGAKHEAGSQSVEDLLGKVRRMVLLDPFPDLAPRGRALRILGDRKIAGQRLAACSAKLNAQFKAQATTEAANASQKSGASRPSLLKHPIKNLESHFKSAQPTETATSPPSDEAALKNLQARWKQQPRRITLWQLEHDHAFAQSEMQLVFDTERITAQICGPPTGDDALLLEMSKPTNP